MTYYNPATETLIDRLSTDFLSDTPAGKKMAFFAWFDAHKDYESFDGHEAQKREMDAGVTAMDWAETSRYQTGATPKLRPAISLFVSHRAYSCVESV